MTNLAQLYNDNTLAYYHEVKDILSTKHIAIRNHYLVMHVIVITVILKRSWIVAELTWIAMTCIVHTLSSATTYTLCSIG